MSTAPLPFTLRQLQYVVALGDLRSFRRAAERCHVSQPSLSAQLAQLEDALGVRLFERDRRRVLVTAAGEVVLERARRLLLEADDLVAAARLARDPLVGTLRLGVIPTISPYLLPHVTPALREAFPELVAVWTEDKTDALVEALEAGALDAVLLALEAELGEVEHAVVAVDPFVLAVRPGDPLAGHEGPARRAELADVEVLLLDDGHCFRTQALEYCSRTGTRELEFRATSLTTLAQMVAGGAGVTLLPTLAVPTEAHRAGLEIRELAAPVPSRTIALAWRKRSPLARALQELAITIRRAYPQPERLRVPRRRRAPRRR
ncbi:LysR substrate-binding domain-containing protein [Paraliomyxa miuraensis]|uniref:LysR substrate-binding domain-containing protein n=1 Tax=Paraliomyxa miuraensis TaxID=376150 RepID=UPI002259C351|nr:LysR substrate-binding domain-containing protein [Paraliomyxa miuraensis]MCX4241992.1 LysR substrate-binding domain-containing protein [Paraliomyxa miuraensis]